MTAKLFFDIYLDAQIILLVAAGIWVVSRAILKITPYRDAFLLQLHLTYGVLGAVGLTPLVILLAGVAESSGMVGAGFTPSFSEFALSQYLNGQFNMAPSRFEEILLLRASFTQSIFGFESPLGVAIASFLLIGTIIYTSALVRNGMHVHQLVRNAYLWKRIGKVEVRFTDQAHVPFSTRGIRQQYIVIPSLLLSQPGDLKIAISHELQHMRQGDLAWEFVLEVLRPVFFWNPAFWLLKRNVENLRELACDQQVLATKRYGIRAYCDCLLRICQNSLSGAARRHILVPTVPLVQVNARGKDGEPASFLKQRVVSMLAKVQTHPGKLMSSLIILPVVLVISLASLATQNNTEWSHDRLMLSSIVNLERLDQRNKTRN